MPEVVQRLNFATNVVNTRSINYMSGKSSDIASRLRGIKKALVFSAGYLSQQLPTSTMWSMMCVRTQSGIWAELSLSSLVRKESWDELLKLAQGDAQVGTFRQSTLMSPDRVAFRGVAERQRGCSFQLRYNAVGGLIHRLLHQRNFTTATATRPRVGCRWRAWNRNAKKLYRLLRFNAAISCGLFLGLNRFKCIGDSCRIESDHAPTR